MKQSTSGQSKQKLIIPGKFGTLNEYINKSKSFSSSNGYRRWNSGNSMKVRDEKIAMTQIYLQELEPVNVIQNFKFTFYEENKRRDKDNVSAYARKFIFDALQKANILILGDGWRGVNTITEEFKIDKDNPRIEIEFEDAEI